MDEIEVKVAIRAHSDDLRVHNAGVLTASLFPDVHIIEDGAAF